MLLERLAARVRPRPFWEYPQDKRYTHWRSRVDTARRELADFIVPDSDRPRFGRLHDLIDRRLLRAAEDLATSLAHGIEYGPEPPASRIALTIFGSAARGFERARALWHLARQQGAQLEDYEGMPDWLEERLYTPRLEPYAEQIEKWWPYFVRGFYVGKATWCLLLNRQDRSRESRYDYVRGLACWDYTQPSGEYSIFDWTELCVGQGFGENWWFYILQDSSG